MGIGQKKDEKTILKRVESVIDEHHSLAFFTMKDCYSSFGLKIHDSTRELHECRKTHQFPKKFRKIFQPYC